MNKKLYSTEDRELALVILGHFQEHPEAKDTLDGIEEFWIPHDSNAVMRATVERALRFLVSRGLVLEIRRKGLPPYYRKTQETERH